MGFFTPPQLYRPPKPQSPPSPAPVGELAPPLETPEPLGPDDRELKVIDSLLRAGGFPDTEDRNYWLKRIRETSGTIDDYWKRRFAAGPNGQDQFHGSGNAGDLIAPFTTPFTGQGQFSYGAFTPPTGQQLLDDDPGYGFRKGQGAQALLQNRAFRGTLNTGGTVKDFLDYNQSAASQEYKNAFDRAYSTYGTNRETAQSVYDRGLQEWLARFGVHWGNRTNASDALFRQQEIGLNAAR